MVKITAMEQNKEKRMKRNEDSLREPWDNIKCTSIHIIGISEEVKEMEETGPEKIFEEIIEDSGTPLQYSCLQIPWMEEPGRLQSMGSLRVQHN